MQGDNLDLPRKPPMRMAAPVGRPRELKRKREENPNAGELKYFDPFQTWERRFMLIGSVVLGVVIALGTSKFISYTSRKFTGLFSTPPPSLPPPT